MCENPFPRRLRKTKSVLISVVSSVDSLLTSCKLLLTTVRPIRLDEGLHLSTFSLFAPF